MTNSADPITMGPGSPVPDLGDPAGAPRPGLAIAIPTFGRESVLLDTVRALLAQSPAADEILIVDQTPDHEQATQTQLSTWQREGRIRWLRIARPSITGAMNLALREARHDLLLFLDDDIRPEPGLIAGHRAAHADSAVWAVVGQVLQPGQAPSDVSWTESTRVQLTTDLAFPFHGRQRHCVQNCIACNLSVKRAAALRIGGFDENFRAVAYRFETDFARRLGQAGGRVVFEPAAVIHHLRAARGGTRQFANHLTTVRPDHSAGDYYFAYRHARGAERWTYILRRLARSATTRFHLRHPWWIPGTLIGELRGLALATRLARRGPALLAPPVGAAPAPQVATND